MASELASLHRRQGYQSQDITKGGLVDYWGYAARVLPCTNDAGTCEYFEEIYEGHRRGMLYVGIMWGVVGAILFIWTLGRHFWTPRRAFEVPEKGSSSAGGLRKVGSAVASTTRYYMLGESLRFCFGRVSRLQLTILAVLFSYICVFSFVGIGYKEWITPAGAAYLEDQPDLTQKRSWLGPWSDRIGTIAYALTPFSVMLASRESILSLLTGIPYQSFNFLHRWLGWIILIQSIGHTLGWTIIEVIFYQPQPQVAEKWIVQEYMVWGCVAILLICIMAALATPWGIRLTGYEAFRKLHYVFAMLYIGACYGHWQPLKAFMIPGLAIWFVDRGARLIRSFLIHYSYLPDGSMGFQSAQGEMRLFEDDVNGDIVRLDFTHPHSPWSPGQHFFLCFPKSSVWQSHPFTPLSLPVAKDGGVEHSYIFRAKKGETKKLAQMAKAATDAASRTTPVVLQGPYGEDHTTYLSPDVNVLCVAGGTGITYVLPTLLWLAQQPVSPDRKISLVWSVRRRQDIEWVRKELDVLALAKKHGISISIRVTREEATEAVSQIASEKAPEVEASSSASSSSMSIISAIDVARGVHPDLSAVVPSFLEENVNGGRTIVFASGPGGLLTDLRTHVAKVNSGAKVWKGDETGNVELVCDNRLEW